MIPDLSSSPPPVPPLAHNTTKTAGTDIWHFSLFSTNTPAFFFILNETLIGNFLEQAKIEKKDIRYGI